MNEIQSIKVVSVTPPAAIIDNASLTTAEVDTLGYDYATFIVSLGATDIAMTALKLQHSTVSGSGFADIVGANFASGTDIDGNATALPSADDDGKVFVLQVDLRSKNRYLDLVATVGDGTAGAFVSALCILSKPEQAPTSVAGMGAGSVIRVA